MTQTSSQFRLAHISDPHIPPLPPYKPSEFHIKRTIGFINWYLNRHKKHVIEPLTALSDHLVAENFDHIAITGDLVNIGLNEEVERAAIWLSKFGDPAHISVVLGNHDAYTPETFQAALTHWFSYITDQQSMTDEQSINPLQFPTCKLRGKYALIHCNSAVPTAPFMATGHFEEDQAERLSEMLEALGQQQICRIVLIHHPPIANIAPKLKRLIGLERFQQVIAHSGAELVLHGHLHRTMINYIPQSNNAKRIPVLGVSSMSTLSGNSTRQAQYHDILIKETGQDFEINIRALTFGQTTDEPNYVVTK